MRKTYLNLAASLTRNSEYYVVRSQARILTGVISQGGMKNFRQKRKRLS